MRWQVGYGTYYWEACFSLPCLNADGEVDLALDAEAGGPDVLLNVHHPLDPSRPGGSLQPLTHCSGYTVGSGSVTLAISDPDPASKKNYLIVDM